MQKAASNLWQYIIIINFIIIIHISAPLALSKPQESTTYRFGVITLTHPIVLYRQYIPFFDYLNEHLPWSFELVLYKEYSDVVNAIELGDIDMALLGGSTFVQAQRYTNLDPIAAVLSKNHTAQTYGIFMAKSDNDNINSLQDLYGKSIAFGPTQSTSSYIIPLNFLLENSISLKDLSNHINLSNHDAVARAVLRGEYDVGVMGESFAQRFLDQGLKQIAMTNPFPGFILVARTGVPQNVRSTLRSFLLSIDPQSDNFLIKSRNWPEILRYGFSKVVMQNYKVFNNLSNTPDN